MKKRQRFLHVRKILYEYTDEEHALSVGEIVEMLKGNPDSGRWQAVAEDIHELMLAGEKIRKDTAQRKYYIGERSPDETEVSLLVESILSSKLFSEQDTRDLVNKMLNRLSLYQRARIRKRLEVSQFEGRVKSQTKNIKEVVRMINVAIDSDCAVSFRYFGYGPQKEKLFHYGGNFCTVSPYFMTLDNEKYYLIAYSHEFQKKKYYRVDKILDVRVEKEKRQGHDLMESEKAANYSSSHFEMFGGEEVRITLLCTNRAANMIIDKFTKAVPMIREDEEHFIASVMVKESPLFYGWLFSMGEDIVLLRPETTVENFKRHLETVTLRYQDPARIDGGM